MAALGVVGHRPAVRSEAVLRLRGRRITNSGVGRTEPGRRVRPAVAPAAGGVGRQSLPESKCPAALRRACDRPSPIARSSPIPSSTSSRNRRRNLHRDQFPTGVTTRGSGRASDGAISWRVEAWLGAIGGRAPFPCPSRLTQPEGNNRFRDYRACAIAAFWPTAAAVAQVHRFYVSALHGGIDAGARGPISSGRYDRHGTPVFGSRRVESGSRDRPRLPHAGSRMKPADEQSGRRRDMGRSGRAGLPRGSIEPERTGLRMVGGCRLDLTIGPAVSTALSSRRRRLETIRRADQTLFQRRPSPSVRIFNHPRRYRTIVGGGPTGGFRVLMQLTPRPTAGPEFATLGLITKRDWHSVVPPHRPAYLEFHGWARRPWNP